ncbi:hypothetical protein GSI_08710 [Ganoderma sinense ZZ0214-1]|uniref:Peptidase A1 domain-containing protein n=1 Tax=Ganoderma sinense ZZ0214-1 TaxID=1077348 RepID=A0A2G8S4G2_9APHY|nr:hypothetical protein GSI_08710 [Ganoderma sinense ZZ0214-1]
MLPWLRIASVLLLSLPLSTSAAVITRGTSPVTLALTKHYNLTETSKIIELDQARAKGLIERAKTSASDSQLAGTSNVPSVSQGVFYSTTVGIGNPPKNYELIIDTGSSNTWVGAQTLTKPFVPTTSRFDRSFVLIRYGSGQFIGLEFTDTVHIGGLSISNQGFAAAAIAIGFQGIDGILGIGPVGLTCGSLIPDRSKCVPTVTDNASKEGLIDASVVGISFVPTTNPGDSNGELTFGGTDPSKVNGSITYVPITTTTPAGYYVGIDQTISYGNTVILLNGAGITDTGTTLILLATDAFNQYKNLTGAVMDKDTGLLRVTPQQFGNLRSLLFTIGGTPFELIPNAQAWPRRFNSLIGGSPNYVYLIVGNLGNVAGGSIAFINGMSFLERFYHVYDAGNNLAGFARTNYTYALKLKRSAAPSPCSFDRVLPKANTNTNAKTKLEAVQWCFAYAALDGERTRGLVESVEGRLALEEVDPRLRLGQWMQMGGWSEHTRAVLNALEGDTEYELEEYTWSTGTSEDERPAKRIRRDSE